MFGQNPKTEISPKKRQVEYFQILVFCRVFAESTSDAFAAIHVEGLQVLVASESSNIAYGTFQKHDMGASRRIPSLNNRLDNLNPLRTLTGDLALLKV